MKLELTSITHTQDASNYYKHKDKRLSSTVVGNESERHIRYKSRMALLLRRHGYTVFGDHDDEIPVQCDPNSPPYFIDICAISGQRILCIEIDGYKGHNSRRAIFRDKHRTAAITSKLNGKPEFYRFQFFQLKDMDDETIAEELKIC